MKFTIAILLCILGQTAAAGTAVPDILRLTCTFDAETQPPLSVRVVELRASKTEPGTFVWLEEGQAPLPTLAAFANPTNGVISFLAPVTDGTISLLSYVTGGEAELTKHGRSKEGHVLWTTQIGHCDEVKG